MSSKTLRAFGAVLASLLMFVIAVGCGESEESGAGGESPSPAASSAPAPNASLKGEVTIGAALPLTGASATIGKDQERGASLAVDRINSEDGVLGRKLRVVVEDTQSDTVPTQQAARKLVSVDDVPVVIGEYLSNHTIAAGKYLQKAGVAHINPGSSSPDISDIGDFSFSSIGLDTLAGRFVAEQLRNAGRNRIAYIGPNNAYGAEFARVIEDRFTELGGEVATSILYTEGQSSYRAELERLKDSGADTYVYATYAPDNATINRQAFELGMDASKFFGIYLTLGIEGVPPEAIAGQRGHDLAYTGAEGQSFLEAYRAKYGEDPVTPYAGYVYDAVLLAAAAMNEAQSTEPAEVRDAMETIGQDFPGATGSITFDEDGQRLAAPYTILEVGEDGKPNEIATEVVRAEDAPAGDVVDAG